MLQEGCVSERLLKLLRKLQGEEIFKDYFLVGGTALALQIGHRISYDIDLFTKNPLQIHDITGYLTSKYPKKFQILNTQNMIFQTMIEGIKVDFVHHPFELVEPVFIDNQIRYLGRKDIAAMKLHAIETSGNRAKDFVDIFFLLKEIPVSKMFKYYQKKYATDNIFNVKRSLAFFDDIPKDSWNEIRFLCKQIPSKVIKKTIINALKEFNEKL